MLSRQQHYIRFLGWECRKKKVDGWPLTGMEKVQWAHLSVDFLGEKKRESSRMLDLTWPELTMESNHQ